jgi:hypothetical protein
LRLICNGNSHGFGRETRSYLNRVDGQWEYAYHHDDLHVTNLPHFADFYWHIVIECFTVRICTFDERLYPATIIQLVLIVWHILRVFWQHTRNFSNDCFTEEVQYQPCVQKLRYGADHARNLCLFWDFEC